MIEVVLDVVIRLLPTIHSCAVDQIVLVGRGIPCFGAFIHHSLRMVHLSLLPLASLVGLCHGEIVALEDLHLLLHSFHLSCYCMAYFFS